MASPELVRATVLLTQGDRMEAAHWLGLYLRENPDAAQVPQVRWLQAQAATARDERLLQLRALARIPGEDRYRQLARQSLAIEERYAQPLQTRQRWRKWWIILGVLGAVAGVLVLLAILMPAPAVALVTTATAVPTPTATPVLTATPAAAPMALGSEPVEYNAGVLLVEAVEDGAQNVVTSEGQPAIPIIGAHFYVVYVSFECRIGICQRPPEADVTLLQDDNFEFVPRTDLSVWGVPPLGAVALGIPTTGVIVFEIPIIGVPESLRIAPRDERNTYTVALPAGVPR